MGQTVTTTTQALPTSSSVQPLYRIGQVYHINNAVSEDILYGVIFSFISFKELASTTRLVCKYWNRWGEQTLPMECNFKLQVQLYGRNERIDSFINCLGSGHFLNLRELTLEHVNMQVLREISLLKVRSNVKYFNIQANNIGAEGAGFISNSIWFSNLEQLILNGCNIGAEGINHLVNSEFITKLTHLNVRYNKIENTGFKYLVKSKKLSQLRYLDIGKNKIEGSSLVNFKFPSSNILINLQNLHMDENNLYNDFTKLLLVNCQFNQLEELSLYNTHLEDDCIESGLSISPHFRTLLVLNLGCNHLTEKSIQSILNSTYLNGLQYVNCKYSKSISYEWRKKMIEKYQRVEISSNSDNIHVF